MCPLPEINESLRARYGTSTLLPGLAPDLIVRHEAGWHPATALRGPLLDELLAKAQRHWRARPATAAALAWKAYTYWVCLPAVTGWLAVRQVPLLSAANVLVRLDGAGFVTVGLRAGLPVAVGPSPGAALAAGAGDLLVVPDPLAAMRSSLLEEHLLPVLDAIAERARVGRRTLLGSVAAAVAATGLRAADPPGTVRLLTALGLDDLVEVLPGGPRRRTCCLAFTLPIPKICRDCCLRTSPPPVA
ncbi:hypothetical protein ACQP2F_20155 [Actinoplanes sp. CA-030573]|uniref:hypothetical protein n=1 Tax=Actinoplanes sp. CA-030573 TaxID=3239898 RepID=UPI003D8CBFA0